MLSSIPTTQDLKTAALRVLEDNWNTALQSTLPHRVTYPHRWLWDSCFHSMAWTSLGRPEGLIELAVLLGSQLPTPDDRGFMPHMVYGDDHKDGGKVDRGPIWGMSSFTQPPVYVMALTHLHDLSVPTPAWLLDAATAALDWLWRCRLSNGLLVILHPWESGADISPRFDDWYGTLDDDNLDGDYDRLVRTTTYSPGGAALANPGFSVATAAFNAIAQDAASRLAQMTGSALWRERAQALSTEIDRQLWDESEQMWRDRPNAPSGIGEASSRIPTLDGIIAALGSGSKEHALSALTQCVGAGRFAAPFGPSYLPHDHRLYQPDRYWRGSAWPQINHLLIAVARKHRFDAIAHELTARAVAGVWESGFSEYWNPETGAACGATPQSWSTIAVTLV